MKLSVYKVESLMPYCTIIPAKAGISCRLANFLKRFLSSQELGFWWKRPENRNSIWIISSFYFIL